MAKKGEGVSTGVIIWAVTFVAVMAILSVAYSFVHKKAPPSGRTQGVSAPASVQTAETPPVSVAEPVHGQPAHEQAVLPQHTAGTKASVHPMSPPQAVPLPVPPPPSPSDHPRLKLGHLAGTLRVDVPDTQRGGIYPLVHTCYRANQSPAVTWHGVPRGAKSMVVVLERKQEGKPHAWLWALFNLAPGSGKIPEDIQKVAQLDGGARQARNVYGKAAYTGPCEPHGRIPYAIRLFALDVPLGVAAGASRDDLVRGMNGHIIDAAEYDFVHQRRP